MYKDERLLAAARTDNEDLLLQVFESGDFDINCQDGFVCPHFINETLNFVMTAWEILVCFAFSYSLAAFLTN